MEKETENDSLRAVEKVLGEPAFLEFTQNVWKVRTSLMIASVISLIVVFADLHIDPDSTVIGLKFRGLNDVVLVAGLFVVTSYLLLHFVWSAADSLAEWRLRVTGTKVAFVTTGRFASEHGDYPSDPRQSTLYHWWKKEAPKIGDLRDQISQVKKQLQEINTQVTVQRRNQPNGSEITNAINKTRDAIIKLGQSIDQSQRILAEPRVMVSLQRFDDCFRFFLKSQNLRWILIELTLPIVMGICSLMLLWPRIFLPPV